MTKLTLKNLSGPELAIFHSIWSNFAFEIHEKMTHLGMLKGKLATLLVWCPPGTAYTPWHCIKLAKINFRVHIGPWIGQILHPWKSTKWFFEIFSVLKGQCQQLWPFTSCHRNWTMGWNSKITISRTLEHLDWHICENQFFFRKIQKMHFFNRKHMI